MMNIVIIGAGEVGRYIALILSRENHNVLLIDKDGKLLEQAASTMDVATRVGSGTDWQLLDDLLELSPNIFIALTGDDDSNIVACSIAKHLGYPRTIARVRDNRFLNRIRLDFARIFDIDYFICPELLVANDILKHMLNPGSVVLENFAHGAVQLKTIVVPGKWHKGEKPLSHLKLPSGLMVGLIHRNDPSLKQEKIIFPHGNDYIKPHDEVTFIGETEVISNVHQFFDIESKKIESVVIAGGSLTAINLAKLLKNYHIDVRIIEKDFNKCTLLADRLPYCTILNHDATDLAFLQAEKIELADVFVACTGNDEVNLMAAMLAKETGCKDVSVLLANQGYLPLLGRLGISYTVSPKVSASNHILSQILSGTVTSLVSLYENQAEIMEINVSPNSKMVGIPLSELGPLFPHDFLIAMIQNRGRIMIANGNRIISPGDTVIVLTNPKHVPELKKLF